MLSRLLWVCCLAGLASTAAADDTLVILPAGHDPLAITGPTTVTATFNGQYYDDIRIIAWFRDIGSTSTTEEWRGYQIGFDHAIPTPGCTGDVQKVVDTITIDSGRPDWLHAGTTGFFATADAPGIVASAMSSVISCPCPSLDDTAAYLCELEYRIMPGTSGIWRVRPRCLDSEACPHTLHCTHSYVACESQATCPRYAVLGDAEDACTLAISPDAETYVQSETAGRAAHDLFELTIEIPVGRCCDGQTCLGVWTEEDCAANNSWVWTEGADCDMGCAVCGDGNHDDGEECDDGNTTDGDGCDSNCTVTGCGNGVVTEGETCDDGNTVDGDGCSSWCEDEAYWEVIGSTPAMDESLWRLAHNYFRIETTATPEGLTLPLEGEILIQPLLPEGVFGEDLSASFSFDVDGSAIVGRELDAVLMHGHWYAVRSIDGFSGVQPFELHFVCQVGDANNDGMVLPNDLSAINAYVPDFDAEPDSRFDINGDGRVLPADLSGANSSIPSFIVNKPNGH